MEKQRMQTHQQKLNQSLEQVQRESKKFELKNKPLKLEEDEVDLKELNLEKLVREQAKDIQEIEYLQGQIEKLSGNLTLGDVCNFTNFFNQKSLSKYEGMSKQKKLKSLQREIERYQNEIKLVKAKLMYKQQLLLYKKERD